MRGQEAGWKKKDGARKKTKPYSTIPSRVFAPGKLPLDRPHQGAVMLSCDIDAAADSTHQL